MKIQNKKQNNKGFALLFSVLVSSLLLTIGLSILNVSLKELAISTASRQSVFAFYAADSGLEYALYGDTKWADIIKTLNLVTKSSGEIVPTSIPAGAPNDSVVVDSKDLSGPNYYVIVDKRWADGSMKKIVTTITSTGHDTKSGDKVERAIYQSY